MMKSSKGIDPTILIIFGATGELARERLIPGLYHLFDRGLLPRLFWMLGFARSEFSHEAFRKRVTPPNAGSSWRKFSKKIHYVSGNFANSGDFQRLAKYLHGLENRGHSCANRLFYFATLPSHYETISHELDRARLLVGCRIHKRKTRVIIEKPFGHDLASAKKLDKTLHKYFSEEQIYRIDHYLAKETVQNLLTVRFANSIFEPIWNRNYVDHVQISALENVGIGNRGAFYEQAGALRDVTQNHLMQLLALTAMEPPSDFSTTAIRNERAKVIKAVKPQGLVAGQYQGYSREPHVGANSQTETYAAVKLSINNQRWSGVPFYLRTGKFLKKKVAQISIHFKPVFLKAFADEKLRPNVLVFEIQPDEGIFLYLMAKYPGFGIRLHPVTMELGYRARDSSKLPRAYERLLLDFMEDDQRLFARTDEIENSWKFIDTLEKRKGKLIPYSKYSWGPKQGDTLMKKDKREWLIM